MNWPPPFMVNLIVGIKLLFASGLSNALQNQTVFLGDLNKKWIKEESIESSEEEE